LKNFPFDIIGGARFYDGQRDQTSEQDGAALDHPGSGARAPAGRGSRTAEWQRRLEDKKIRLEACGSIAEASLQIQKVFQTAQAAADQYLSEVREEARRVSTRRAERMLAEARQKADAQVRAAAERLAKFCEEESRRKAGVCWDRPSAAGWRPFMRAIRGWRRCWPPAAWTIQIPTTGSETAKMTEQEGRRAPVLTT
jgi:hypothetical protein